VTGASDLNTRGVHGGGSALLARDLVVLNHSRRV